MQTSPHAIDSNAKLTESRAVFRRRCAESSFQPAAAVILGSGLGGVADQIEPLQTIGFDEIPHLPVSSAAGHRGQFILGHLESVPIIALAGRLHRYEGVSHFQATLPVHLMAGMGVRLLIVSNAAGGLNPRLRVGDIVVIRDHLNWIAGSFTALTERISDGLPSGMPMRRGPLYDPALSSLALRTADQNKFRAIEGTYLATLGPTYESRGEYRMMRRMGADVAGMSTVPEVLVAKQYEIDVLALSLVSNVANPDQPAVATHEEVLAAGRMAAVRMETILRAALVSLRE